jgi:hypothetical protein
MVSVKNKIIKLLFWRCCKSTRCYVALLLRVAEPDHERAQRNKMYYEQMLRQEEAVMGNVAQQNQAPPPLKNERPRDAYRSSQGFHNYERLCRGEEIRVTLFRLARSFIYRSSKMFT